jgi:hypothetical protein
MRRSADGRQRRRRGVGSGAAARDGKRPCVVQGERGLVSNAAIVQARDQLGAALLAALFTHTATVWTTAAGGHRALARVGPAQLGQRG